MGLLSIVAGCGGSRLTGSDNDASTDHAIVTDSGSVACGEAFCNPSEVCVVPPCDCITLAEPSCPAPNCVTPTPENPVDCAPLDGGVSGPVTSVDGGSSRLYYHVCI